jgi:lipopolysaccharide export system protein LptA
VAHYNDLDEIERVECQGNVEVSDGERWAKGERAQFDNLKGMLEITGSPEARQGPNRLWADKILYDLNRDSLRGEGNVRTVFESGQKGMPKLSPKGGRP